MKIHHLNCGSMCPYGGRLMSGSGPLLARAEVVCHCLLIEGRDGLILVDTGFGTAVCDGTLRLPGSLRFMTQPELRREETAVAQLQAKGFKPSDVRHIVVTHLDFDHAGALHDFPQASVHVYDTELTTALAPPTFREKQRYLQKMWRHEPKWVRHTAQGEGWMGFESVRALGDYEQDEVLLVPLHGHTRGHCGVAVRTGGGWLLHCGDAYFFHTEMALDPHCPAGLSAYQRILAMDNDARIANQRRLHQTKHAKREVTVFSAHCPHEFRAAQG